MSKLIKLVSLVGTFLKLHLRTFLPAKKSIVNTHYGNGHTYYFVYTSNKPFRFFLPNKT